MAVAGALHEVPGPKLVVDTSVLLAATDTSAVERRQCAALLERFDGTLVIPATVVAEAACEGGCISLGRRRARFGVSTSLICFLLILVHGCGVDVSDCQEPDNEGQIHYSDTFVAVAPLGAFVGPATISISDLDASAVDRIRPCSVWRYLGAQVRRPDPSERGIIYPGILTLDDGAEIVVELLFVSAPTSASELALTDRAMNQQTRPREPYPNEGFSISFIAELSKNEALEFPGLWEAEQWAVGTLQLPS